VTWRCSARCPSLNADYVPSFTQALKQAVILAGGGLCRIGIAHLQGPPSYYDAIGDKQPGYPLGVTLAFNPGFALLTQARALPKKQPSLFLRLPRLI